MVAMLFRFRVAEIVTGAEIFEISLSPDELPKTPAKPGNFDSKPSNYTSPAGKNLTLEYIVQNFALNLPVHSDFCDSKSFLVKIAIKLRKSHLITYLTTKDLEFRNCESTSLFSALYLVYYNIVRFFPHFLGGWYCLRNSPAAKFEIS
jgi:hypothetical protein